MKHRLLVYINPYAMMKIDNHVIRDYISEHLNTDEWEFNEVLFDELPECMEEMASDPIFSHGLATSSYKLIQRGGVFINPMYYGLAADLETWMYCILNDEGFHQSIQYLDIPLETVRDIIGEEVSDEQYKAATETTKVVVKHLSGNKRHITH